ncbi:methionine biosynthesis protein MetW [Moraxella sp. Pampa]|uniref:methionine biosynthesis protein MetW n=1 Tax=Moraxella sp. Pampa TaxID=3111978 RepID=UPI002B40962D|nr:methionine biosynthesis protein MetW [Moraxella sp. Pampa]
MNNIDHQLAEKWIKPNAKVLDLGCGDGTLLAHLQDRLGVSGYGLEIDSDRINQAIAKGLNIIEQDLNDGLDRFADDSFDTVVMARALQAVKNPQALLNDMLRVAKEGIVTFPNFAYWQNRVYLGIKGIMPMSETLPYQWHNTPNIHLCTFKDFEQLCKDNNICILDTVAINDNTNPPTQLMGRFVKYAPNLLADVAIYRISKN